MIQFFSAGRFGRPLAVVLAALIAMLAAPSPLPAQTASQPAAQGEPSAGPPGNSPPLIRVDEAVSMALRNNLSLEAAGVSRDAKKRNSDVRWNVFIPTVDLAGNLLYPNEATTGTTLIPVPSGVAGLYLVTPYEYDIHQWRLAGSLSISLNLNFSYFEQMRNIRLDYEGGLITYEKAKIQLERDVRKSYIQLLLLQEQIALLRESMATAQRRVNMAQANYQNGLVSELSFLQAQVALENLKPTLDQAENGYKLAMANFAMYLGLPYDTEFELEPIPGETVFIPLEVAELIRQAASGKPDIMELRHSILVLQSLRRQVAYQLRTPTLSLAWNADPAFTKDPMKDNWFNGDDWKQSAGMFRMTLAFRLNTLFPFTTEGSNLRNLDSNLRSLNIGLAQAVRGTELEIYSTVFTLEQARSTVEAQRMTVDLAERTYQLTEQAYQAGLSELLEVQNAELELRRARLGILEQNYNYMRGLIDLEYSIGVPFGTLSNAETRSGDTE